VTPSLDTCGSHVALTPSLDALDRHHAGSDHDSSLLHGPVLLLLRLCVSEGRADLGSHDSLSCERGQWEHKSSVNARRFRI
jgi:hypothetical protein